ncbi:uncharacterized protein L969DRAFT_49250 [Mixia osmundae IAM 14324]|uniref:Uncharacterized protein n=1 Tax=Mixia osmundae (strain CBS 9802 / IAM 14324 / JCM 22182 / KY 12970) TaxID=764103 RepID=G7DVQ0_MIXOS|nr:uncharacterized protein L969DRAFT_49250 [Mixia osmundae IAM 14324]KEI39658.1 hypothetical protein L969DRAFT_49250 [Mixia osmundae IAM 14324]GAA94660.1 hypothetical protein E5Q_01313 [Mixia osmundae IAM 14324]
MRSAVVSALLSVWCATVAALPSYASDRNKLDLLAGGNGVERRAVGPRYGPDLNIYFVASPAPGAAFDQNSIAYIARFQAHVDHQTNGMSIYKPMQGIRAKWESSNESKTNGDLLEHCYTSEQRATCTRRKANVLQ